MLMSNRRGGLHRRVSGDDLREIRRRRGSRSTTVGKRAQIDARSAGMVSAHEPRTVSHRRVTHSALVLLAAIAGMMATTPLLGSQVHPVCVSKHHDCDTTPRFVECCCLDQSSTSDQGAPVQSRLQLLVKLSADHVAPVDLAASVQFQAVIRPSTSPPRAHAQDLPTLFATLLI
jgi:hypothetical protein